MTLKRFPVWIFLLVCGFALPALAQNTSYQVIFSSDRNSPGLWQLYVMEADGSNPRRLLTGDGGDSGAVIAPNGQEIAFTRRDALGKSQVVVLNLANGRTLFTVTGNNPSWSPDGSQLVYAGLDGVTNPELYIISASGFNNRQFTENPARDVTPAWSPRGDLIAFKSNRDGETALYVVRPDGTEVRQLVTVAPDQFPPVWSP
ncbi:MAG: TolB family protein, partial [Phototrophicaceae bacterium]